MEGAKVGIKILLESPNGDLAILKNRTELGDVLVSIVSSDGELIDDDIPLASLIAHTHGIWKEPTNEQ